jgi:hypothetical protein
MENYKILGQELSGQFNGPYLIETILYEVPENTQCSISTIQITNSSNTDESYSISFVSNSDKNYSPMIKNTAVYDKVIKPGQTHEIKGGITLSSGDQVRVKSVSDEVIFNAYGVEIV